MTETTKTVFEKYQVRLRKKQKSDFRSYVIDTAEGLGYDAKEDEKYYGATNIIVGNPETAKVIYTAHYDTAPVLPFPNFITPKRLSIYILYNIGLVLAMFAVVFGVTFGLTYALSLVLDNFSFEPATLDLVYEFVELGILIGILILISAGPANKHTANDNTSGVTTLLDLMAAMPQELREKAAFIFFDCEEMGLIGSSGYAGKHKDIKKNSLVINFDCVSDGDNFIFAVNKKANKEILPILQEAYKSDRFSVEVLDKGVFYPSDQKCFKNGVGVAALKKSKGGILYMNRIHTKHDTVYCEENIEYLVNASVKFTEMV